MRFFVLTTIDAEDIHGKVMSAYQIATERLAKGLWPLYRNTKNKFLIAPGHECLVYIGGEKQNRQTIIAQFTVKEVKQYSYKKHDVDQDAVTDMPLLIITFAEHLLWRHPIEIRPLLGRLKFINGQRKWGLMLMGGCKPIPPEDYWLIVKGLSEENYASPNKGT